MTIYSLHSGLLALKHSIFSSCIEIFVGYYLNITDVFFLDGFLSEFKSFWLLLQVALCIGCCLFTLLEECSAHHVDTVARLCFHWYPLAYSLLWYLGVQVCACFGHTCSACFVCDTCMLGLKMLSLNVWAQLRSVRERWLYCSYVFTSLYGCAAFLPQLLHMSFSSTVYVFILVLLRAKPQSCASISCISTFLQGPFLYSWSFPAEESPWLELKSSRVPGCAACCLCRVLLVYFTWFPEKMCLYNCSWVSHWGSNGHWSCLFMLH